MPAPEDWRTSMTSALAAWRASLTPEALSEIDALRQAAKANRNGRKAARLERDRRILAAVLAGSTVDAIAAELGVTTRTVHRRVAELGVEVCRGRLRRAPAAWVKPETRDAIEALAAERGVSAGEVVERALAALFEDGAVKARNLLRHGFKSASAG